VLHIIFWCKNIELLFFSIFDDDFVLNYLIKYIFKRKTFYDPVYLCGQTALFKNIEFYFCSKLIFLVFLNSFDVKNKFKKIKNYFDDFKTKNTLKNNYYHNIKHNMYHSTKHALSACLELLLHFKIF
jgi:nucleoside diphosphate kinase